MKGHAQIQRFLLLLNTVLTPDVLQQSGSKSIAIIFCPVIAHFHEALRVVGDTTLPLQSHQLACAGLPSQDVSAARPTKPRHLVPVTSAYPQRGKKKKKAKNTAFVLREHHTLLLVGFKTSPPFETLNSILCEQPDKKPGRGPLSGQQEVSWDKRSKLRNAFLGPGLMYGLGSLRLGTSQQKNVLRVTVGFD